MLGIASLHPTYGLILGVSGVIAFSDILHRRINNYLVLIVAVLAMVISGFSAFAVIPFAIATGIGLVLFGFGIFAGGDIKLMLAFLLGIDTQWWPVVFLLTAVIGGVMAAGYLLIGLYKKDLNQVRKKGIPYGVPIVISGLLGILLTTVG